MVEGVRKVVCVCIVLRATCRTYGVHESRDEGAPTRPGKSCAKIQWPNRFARRRELN